jgi:transcriptional regulator with XRE-family HTH domain
MECEKTLKLMIGKNIAFRRNELRLTQRQLGEHISISSAQLAQMERGASLPSIITLVELHKVLKVDFNYFFQGLDDL